MDLEQSLWWVSIGTECTALASLLLRRVGGRYRWFTSYLACLATIGVALHLAGAPNRTSYAVAWMITEPILLTLLVLSTAEIVGKIPEHYRGFGAFGRQKLRRLLDVAVVLALLSSVIEAAGPQWKWSLPLLLRFTIALHRMTTSILALYLVLVAVFVSRVRVPFRRNLLVHSRLFACYLSLQTGVMLYFVAIGHGTKSVNDFLTGATSVLFLLWTVLLSRKGEALPPLKILTPEDIRANEERERALQEAAKRYSDRPLG
jgi:hypothetical protein